jgi:hypothetical protein
MAEKALPGVFVELTDTLVDDRLSDVASAIVMGAGPALPGLITPGQGRAAGLPPVVHPVGEREPSGGGPARGQDDC